MWDRLRAFGDTTIPGVKREKTSIRTAHRAQNKRPCGDFQRRVGCTTWQRHIKGHGFLPKSAWGGFAAANPKAKGTGFSADPPFTFTL
jgi:hypothetical protein